MTGTVSNVNPNTGTSSLPGGGIGFRDMEYISKNKDSLRLSTWDEAKEAFIRSQPEPKKMQEFRNLQEQYVSEIQPLNEKAEEFKQFFDKKDKERQNEFAVLEYIAKFKSTLLEILPDDYFDDGRRFLNNFILQKNENNLLPWEDPKHDNFKGKVKKFFLKPVFEKFNAEFAHLSSDFNCFNPQFDITAPKQEVEEDINKRYDYSEQKAQYDEICKKIAEITKKQEDLALAMAQERKSLSQKVERFKTYYDQHLFDAKDYNDIPFSMEKEKHFEKYITPGGIWESLMLEAKDSGVHFAEIEGLLNEGVPIAAVYDSRMNRFLCNRSFLDEEQIFVIADVLLDMQERPLGGDYNVKARYQYELCRRAEHVARLIALSDELSFFLPNLKILVSGRYPQETTEYLTGKTAAEKYGKVFVKVFSIPERRKEAEDSLCRQMQAESNIVLSEREKEKIASLTLGEIAAPFVTRGAPMINEHPVVKLLLNQISLDGRTRLQAFANKDNDYSLLEMSEFK